MCVDLYQYGYWVFDIGFECCQLFCIGCIVNYVVVIGQGDCYYGSNGKGVIFDYWMLFICVNGYDYVLWWIDDGGEGFDVEYVQVGQ